jgi:antitoxin HigA-1
MRPIHPEEILKDELEELKLSANKFVEKLHVPTNRITAILNGKRVITADTALRLSAFFGTSAEFWLKLQNQNAYDLKITEMRLRKKIKIEVDVRMQPTFL